MSQGNRIYQLSQLESNQGVIFSNPYAAPGHHCPMHTSLASIKNLRGVSSLVIGMPECSFYSRYVMEESIVETGELHYTYVLDSNEVVFGCRDGVLSALLEMEQDGAEAIVVIMTCIPALIGEDIKELTETFSLSHKAKAVCMDLAHYKRNGYEAGYYETYQALAGFCKDDLEKKRSVAILGNAKGEESDTLKKWLLSESYEIVELGAKFNLKEFLLIAKSRLLIVTDIHYLPLAKRLKKEHDLPYIFLGGAYAVDEVAACYEAIQKELEMDALPAIVETSSLKKLEEEIKECFMDRSFLVTASIPDVLILTNYLTSLSMKPLYLHIEEYQVWMKEWKEQIRSKGVDPYVSYLVQKDLEKSFLNQINIQDVEEYHFAISDFPVKGMDTMQIGRFFLAGLIGYERTRKLLHCLQEFRKETGHAII